MPIEISSTNDRWDHLIGTEGPSLIYYSESYRKFLEGVVGGTPYYLVAKEGGKTIGILPCFHYKSKNLGSALNSLPFFGSHGGPIGEIFEVKEQLIKRYLQLQNELNVSTATLVCSPFDDNEKLRQLIAPDYTDSRIGQFTMLPKTSSPERLMDVFHSKTRNMIRKALKADFSYQSGKSLSKEIQFFHEENMQRISGQAKTDAYFTEIAKMGESHFVAAFKNGEMAAGLIYLRYKETIEYFTPVINEKYRSEQPLSGLIFETMRTEIEKGAKVWNWGGTWKTQDGVYRFKSRFGAKDYPYSYYTNLLNKGLLEEKPECLLREFPGYFSVPFSELQK